MLDRHGEALIRLAAASIEHGLRHGSPLAAVDQPEALRRFGAAFVTLRAGDRLRGCVGSIEAVRPLGDDVRINAYSAAFADTRFPPLTAAERTSLRLGISVLTPPQTIDFTCEDNLLEQLRPGRDGIVISGNGRRAVFLPQVWEQLSQPRDFLEHLKLKAGFSPTYWSDDIRAQRFSALSVSSDALTQPVWS
ncbi:MAG: AmmeMemoRadiSam system protein A [Rhodospirillales bacterium]|nr:AmmeMemoRadiSam system protein A [Rhodospirillales bacterium]